MVENNKKAPLIENPSSEDQTQEKEVFIKVEGQEEQALGTQGQGKPDGKEPEREGQERGRSGGILGKIWNALEQTPIVGLLFKAIGEVVSTPSGQGQSDNRDTRSKEDPIQPESVLQGEWLKNLSPETKQEVEKEGKELQKKFEMPQGSSQSIDGPSHTPNNKQESKDGPQIGN